MIARVQGTLLSSDPCVLDVGGVGFELKIADKDRAAIERTLGDRVSFHTYLHVREDQLTLFGFLHRQDRELFTRLIGVSGVGPRIALNVMGEHSTARIVAAIVAGDHAFLARLPGIGKKTAERLTVELKDKVGYLGEGAAATVSPFTQLREEAILALGSLGLPRAAAEKALDKIDWSGGEERDVPEIVKEALKHATSR